MSASGPKTSGAIRRNGGRHHRSVPALPVTSSALHPARRRSSPGSCRSASVLLLTSITGASPQAPKHSPSLSVNRPSGVVSPKPDPEAALEMLRRLRRTRQRTRQVGADRQLVPADRLEVVHLVERRDLVHRDRRHAQIPGDEVHRSPWTGDRARPARSRAPPSPPTASGPAGTWRSRGRFWRAFGTEHALLTTETRAHRATPGFLCVVCLCSPAHRSISPKTISMVPMMATASAIMWPRAKLVHGGEVRKPRRADLHAVGLVGAVRHEVDAELALGGLDRRVGLARRQVHALGEELEVMDQLFHVRLHFHARRRRHLVVVR